MKIYVSKGEIENMKSLFPEHEIIDSTELGDIPTLNGIPCPKCGIEMVDSVPTIILSTWPPQVKVECLSCDYKGTREK